MKINEVEKLLGITKANIRFYEKEGLLAPGRTEGGYRDYSDADIGQLKQIIILRKLGIPVQQIADILDGVMPLQDAITANIDVLNAEIEKLNGSLFLCQQLQNESATELDTDRYWTIIQQKEQQGLRFQSIVSDYITFIAPALSRLYWVPEDAWQKPSKWIKYLLGWSVAFAAVYALLGKNFWEKLISIFGGWLIGIGVWCIVLLPLFVRGKNNQKVKEFLSIWLPVIMIILTIVVFMACIVIPFL